MTLPERRAALRGRLCSATSEEGAGVSYARNKRKKLKRRKRQLPENVVEAGQWVGWNHTMRYWQSKTR